MLVVLILAFSFFQFRFHLSRTILTVEFHENHAFQHSIFENRFLDNTTEWNSLYKLFIAFETSVLYDLELLESTFGTVPINPFHIKQSIIK